MPHLEASALHGQCPGNESKPPQRFIPRLGSAQDAGVSQGVASRQRPDCESVGAGADGDCGDQVTVYGADRVDDPVVAAGEPEHGAVAEMLPMSGLPPPGMTHFVAIRPVGRSMTVMLPSSRLVTNMR